MKIPPTRLTVTTILRTTRRVDMVSLQPPHGDGS
jgi:hypothetical protein